MKITIRIWNIIFSVKHLYLVLAVTHKAKECIPYERRTISHHKAIVVGNFIELAIQ